MVKALIWKLLDARTCFCVMDHQKNFNFLGSHRGKKWFKKHEHPEFTP